MTTTLRTWLAALALGFSAFVLTLSSPPEALGGRAPLALFVIFAMSWLIAVGERATVPRGGLRVTRFPLGPRLLQVRPGLGLQYFVLLLLLGVVAGWKVAAWGAVITAAVTIHAVRKAAWYVVPAAWVVNTLATMKEFHTLGDIVSDASTLLKSLVVFGLQALVIAGPLLRTDAGGSLSGGARTTMMLTALPAWGSAFWIFSRAPAAGHYLDAEALAATLLFGGLLQSLLIGTVNWLVKIEDRSAESLPHVSANAVGLALMPLALPILCLASLHVLPLPQAASTLAAPGAWMGLMAVLMIVPAALGAGLVGAALDRIDGAGRGLGVSITSGALLALWFLFGPLLLDRMYAPGGLAESLRASFDTRGGGPPLVSAVLPGSSPLSGHAGGQLALFGLPAADLCRAITILILGVAALAARYLRHARLGQRSVGWSAHLVLAGLSAAGAWLLVPRLGAVGAPLSCAGATAMLLVMDLFHREVRVRTPEEIQAEAVAREEADLARRRAEREAMAGAKPREIIS
jgi:hypothetical protein